MMTDTVRCTEQQHSGHQACITLKRSVVTLQARAYGLLYQSSPSVALKRLFHNLAGLHNSLFPLIAMEFIVIALLAASVMGSLNHLKILQGP